MAGLGAGALGMSVNACGYLIYPERKGRSAGRIDTPIFIVDLLWLLPGILPGVICLAVDFSTGCIYTSSRMADAEPASNPAHPVDARATRTPASASASAPKSAPAPAPAPASAPESASTPVLASAPESEPLARPRPQREIRGLRADILMGHDVVATGLATRQESVISLRWQHDVGPNDVIAHARLRVRTHDGQVAEAYVEKLVG